MNETRLSPRLRAAGVKTLLACLAAGLALSPPRARAGMEMAETKQVTSYADKDWTLELGSGVGFSNVRSGQPNQAYTIIPLSLTASLKLDDVSLDDFLGGFLRGYSEFYFRGDADPIIRGPESHYEGVLVGPRYNFVQPGWKIVPFIEGGVGIGFANSNPSQGGLGQDFNFTFDVAAGAKYNLNDTWFIRLGADYQHVSNAGLSEPKFANHPIDALGPKLSVGFSF